MTISRCPLLLPLAATLGLVVSTHVNAASLTWDASASNPTAPTDGSGTWSTSGSSTWASSGTSTVWDNALNNDAVIGSGGTTGTILLTSDITANSLLFKGNTGYNLSGTGVLTLTSGTITSNTTSTITAVLTGTNGLTKLGASTLVLKGLNTYTGTTSILNGTIQARTANGMPPATIVAIGQAGAGNTAIFSLWSNQTVAGIAALGTDLTKSLITSTVTNSGTFILTVNPDGAGGAAADSTFGGVIKDGTGAVGLTKAGSHALTLTGSNSYSGTTTVTAGTLIINGSLSSASAVAVSGSGRLGGTGSIGGSVAVSGTIAAGSGSIGTLSTGDLTINATGALENEFGRSGITPTSDAISVTGAVSLLSGANLQLSLTGSTPVNGDIFYLVNNDLSDAVTGVFTMLNGVNTTLTEGSIFTFNSQSFQITYTADFGSSFTGGNDIAIQTVPEPATCALVGLGAAALLWRRRRRSA